MVNSSLNINNKIRAYSKDIKKIICSAEKKLPKGINTIKLKPLKKDVLELSESSQRWSGSREKFIPSTGKNLQVSMHHEINSGNSEYRLALKNIEKGKITTYKSGRKNIEIPLLDMLDADREFEKLPPLEKDCIIYRGRTKHPSIPRFNEDFKIIENAKVNDIVIPDTGYSYGAFHPETAQNWMSPTEKNMFFEIRLPKGAKVSRNSEHNGEVIMPRGAQYRIVSKETKNNLTNVVLEYILPQNNNAAETEKLLRQFNIPF